MKVDKTPCAQCGEGKDGHIDRIDARPGQCDTWVDPIGKEVKNGVSDIHYKA